MGPDSVNYLSVNADEELTWRPLGVSFPASGQRPRGERPVPELWVCTAPGGLPCPHTDEALRVLRSRLLSVVWLLYGNDYDVAVPSVFL